MHIYPSQLHSRQQKLYIDSGKTIVTHVLFRHYQSIMTTREYMGVSVREGPPPRVADGTGAEEGGW